MRISKLILFIAIIGLVSSCKKVPGEGGKTTLKGKLLGTYLCEDNGNVLEENIGIPDQRVYISYDATGEIDDDTRTNADGEFKFEFLQPGAYSIITYSECLSCATGLEEVVTNVEIAKKEDEVILEDIPITQITGRGCENSGGPGEGGNKTISGNLVGIYINENDYDTIDTRGHADARVYIIYGDGNQQNDNVRSSADGSFQFKGLTAGSYQVYAMSECRTLNCPSGEKAVINSITLDDEDTNVSTEIKILDFRNP